MTTAHKFTVALALVLSIFLGILGFYFMESKIQEARLDEQTKANKQQEIDLVNNNKSIQTGLVDQVAAIQLAAAKISTSPQIVKAAPTYITLPAPIHEVTQSQADEITAQIPNSPVASGDLVIPAISAKPFFDAQVQCTLNKAKLSACTQTLDNDDALLAVKDKQIAEDTVAIKGGSKIHRTLTAMKWIGIGAAVGAITVVAIH